MFTASRIVKPLKLLLVLAAAYSVVMLLFSVPGDFGHDIANAPGAAHLLWPTLLAIEAGILAFLLVIVCTWRLLTMVEKDTIFSEESMRWVDIIVGTFVVGWFVLVALSAYLVAVIFFTPELRDPGVPVLLFGFDLIGAVLVMVVAVLRSLLRRATVLQTDMDEVL